MNIRETWQIPYRRILCDMYVKPALYEYDKKRGKLHLHYKHGWQFNPV